MLHCNKLVICPACHPLTAWNRLKLPCAPARISDWLWIGVFPPQKYITLLFHTWTVNIMNAFLFFLIFIQQTWKKTIFLCKEPHFLLYEPPPLCWGWGRGKQTTDGLGSIALTAAADLTEGAALCQATPKGFSRTDSQNTSKKSLTLRNPEVDTGSGSHFSEIQLRRSSIPGLNQEASDILSWSWNCVSINWCTLLSLNTLESRFLILFYFVGFCHNFISQFNGSFSLSRLLLLGSDQF